MWQLSRDYSRDYSGLHDVMRPSEMSRVSQASFVSHASSALSEDSRLTLGGGTFASFGAVHRMRREMHALAADGQPTEALLRAHERAQPPPLPPQPPQPPPRLDAA
mmetsp:Transcript_24238/g.65050  ORF Transcript_24238/g.65050 Transcript_24238/m.65050 type:complete len:106 (+) Transcript_24238:318-635(+)